MAGVDFLRITVLILATLTVGLMAGTFFVYSVAVMPGLRRTDDRTFVAAFQAVDRAIINPVFLSCFVGALAFTGAAVLLHLPGEARSELPLVAAAFVLYLVTFGLTVRVNVPRNDALKAAGDPDRIADLAAVRRRFDEAGWTRANHARTGLCLVALGLLAWALAAR